jgi:hypothetical protein
MKTSRIKSLPVVAVGVLAMASSAQALITNSANLPPNGVYLDAGIHQTYGGAALQFLLSLPEHAPIAAQASAHPGGAGTVGSPADEIENFPSVLNALAEVIQLGTSLGQCPITATCPTETIVFGKIGNVTGTFDTEMLSMSLSGVTPLGPFMIRESPTKQSLGKTTITDIGGGLFQIDSFFDVFTELSTDGGATWIPSNNGAGHMVLVPEPTSMSLLAAGFVGLMGFIRRRR